MENLQSRKTLSSLYLLLFHLLQFSSLSLLSSSYTLPDKYFINCGSDSNSTLNRRNFVGDVNSTFSSAAGGQTSAVSTTNSSTTIELYRTARIFKNASSYELEISQIGTYTVRFHFYAFNNLSDAQFNVSASGFSLLSNFTSLKNSPEIKEFLFTIVTRKFTIDFKPSKNSSFAFVNALEVFLVPDNCTVNSAIRISSSGRNRTYDGLLSRVLHPVHRINVGGGALSPENDTLWRNWVPDDGFLYLVTAAKNSSFYSNRPNYQEGGATDYIAPDLVYKTAKEMNIDSEKGSTFFNITWNFTVSKNVPHLVRVHFCDIISKSPGNFKFNLYVFSTFSQKIDPYDVIPQLAAPFYKDFVVNSDAFGFINVSIGPRLDSNNQTAFLNGLEIMEIIGGLSPDLKKLSKPHLVFVIVGSVLGGNISPNSLRTFGEIVDKCLKEYGVERPNMADVLWDLEYALKLQQTAMHKEPREDSTTDVSWVLSVPIVHRLPSDSMTIDEDDVTVDGFWDTGADTGTDTCAF
ncbi:putative receptor-like protein kinase [Camellia lanceoleosa]|uniref:Receptor-like protein kinase n=1 Tax=Camellia lanceoleosa TaxID=1840588 RepID=A0ACC0I651_9ERIC|nr:putative receptor-like protein kinase [Camellia lanceoleosa]